MADNYADLNNSGRNSIWRILYYQTFWGSRIKKVLNYLDLVFGVSPTRYYFSEHFLGIPNDKIRFLPIGADTDFTDKLIQSINTKNSSTIKGTPPLF